MASVDVSPLFLPKRIVPSTTTWKNLVDDYSAVGTGASGVAADNAAFLAWHNYALDNNEIWHGLILPPNPPGGYYDGAGVGYEDEDGTLTNNAPFFGIKKLIVWGYGASIDNVVNGSFIYNNFNHSFPIATVSAGSRTVQLVNPAHAASMIVGDWVMLAGLDIQGFGYPLNNHFFEYRLIRSVSGDVVTFTEPLENGYSSAWPNYNSGSAFEMGGGGPGTIYTIKQGFISDCTVYGLNFRNASNQIYFNMQFVDCVDCTAEAGGIIPTATGDFVIRRMTHTGSNLELDKLVNLAHFVDQGPSNVNVDTQSSSVKDMIFDNCSRIVNGTALRTLIRGGTIPQLRIGPTSYGASEAIYAQPHPETDALPVIQQITRMGSPESVFGHYAFASGVLRLPAGDDDNTCLAQAAAGAGNLTINGVKASGGVATFDALCTMRITTSGSNIGRQVTFTGTNLAGGTINQTVTLSSASGGSSTTQFKTITQVAVNGAVTGTIKIGTVELGPVYWAVPGRKMTLQSIDASPLLHTIFDVTDVSKNGSGDTLVTTTMAGSTLPVMAASANDKFVAHGPKLYFEAGVTGCDEAIELALPSAYGKRFGTYTFRTYTGTPHQASGWTRHFNLGTLVHIKINVTQAYTGTAPTLQAKLQLFGAKFVKLSDMSLLTTAARVNLKTAGLREMYPDGRVLFNGVNTGTGGSGDVSLSDLAQGLWCAGTHFACFIGNNDTAVNVSAEAAGVRPIFTIEVLCDQGD